MPAGADECVPSTSDPELDASGQYFDNDLCQVPPGDPTTWSTPSLSQDHDGDGNSDQCLFSLWFYTEANGIDGLQRQDEVVDDTCGGQIVGDSLTFF